MIYEIVALGEMLVDFTETIADNGDIMYKQNPGGAPANVAVMASKLNAPSAFIGKLGKDMFGSYLKETLKAEKVGTEGLVMDKAFSTTLAFVRTKENGEREFVFYRKNGADLNLNYHEINLKLIDNCKILHFGALMLSAEPSKSAVVNAVEYAKQKGKIISYDPNWREHFWKSKSEAVQAMRSVLRYVDIIKVSELELQIITESGNLIPAIAKLLNYGIKIVLITQGAKGCITATKSGIERLPTYKVETVDTLGAGDSFLGAFLAKLSSFKKPFDALEMPDLKNFAIFANACGALSSAKVGAIPSMPTEGEIQNLLDTGRLDV
jgi:fructokinase